MDAASPNEGREPAEVFRDWVEQACAGHDKPSGVVDDLLSERRVEFERESRLEDA